MHFAANDGVKVKDNLTLIVLEILIRENKDPNMFQEMTWEFH